MRRILASFSIASALLLCSAPALAADAPGKDDSKTEINLPPMSPDKTIEQVVGVEAPALRYNATVGHIDVRDAKGKTIGQVVFTAYAMPGANARRSPSPSTAARARRRSS